jgi:hypothetical protein
LNVLDFNWAGRTELSEMTVERKILFGLDDIKAISFQCDSCKYRITMSPDEVRDLPRNCPNGHRWIVGEQQAKTFPPIQMFSDNLVTLRKLAEQKVLGFKILLEFDEPKLI